MARSLLLAVLAALLLVNSAFAVSFVAQDPTRYVPNARVLGLGKAFTGLADDVGSIFINPAGIVEAKGWELSTMSGKFLDEYTYLSMAGFYPTAYGVFGIGYASTAIGGAWATTIEAGSDPNDPVYTIDPSVPQMGNYNNATMLTYANQLSQLGVLSNIPQSEHIAVGANLKLFKTALYGGGITGGDASGNEIDFGVKYAPNKWSRIGAAVQNLLPTGMGGKLTYAAGHVESYPAIFLLGSSINLLGIENSLYKLGENSLKVMLDFESHPTLPGYPNVWHAGAEWKPLELVALRAGIDQDSAGDGKGGLTVVSDTSYGVGIYSGGFRFDYAYHTFTGAPNIDNHFFSLAYEYSPPPAQKIPKEGIVIDTESDKTITFAPTIKITGKVIDPRVKKFFVNGKRGKLALNGTFSIEADINVGKNTILLEGQNEKDSSIARNRIRVLRLRAFNDVPAGYWAAKPIALLSMADIIGGLAGNNFIPERNITRAEICAMMMKSLPSSKENYTYTRRLYSDVDPKHWAAKYIMRASELGIVKGVGKNKFEPNKKVSRAEGVSMIARFAGISPASYSLEFPDVFPEDWYSGAVAGAYGAGVLDFLKGSYFEPKKLLTRAEAAELLFHTQPVKQALDKNLLNWDGY